MVRKRAGFEPFLFSNRSVCSPTESGYRYKKTVFASEQQRDDVAAAREQWQTWKQSCDLSKLVFLDETSTSTELIRRYGRALASARCRDAAPAGHGRTLTFIAGLRAD